MEWYILAIAIFASLIFALATGLPVGFSLGVTSILWLLFLQGGDRIIALVTAIPFNTLNSFAFTTFPAYVLMAQILFFTGISRDLIEVVNKWVGRLPGGLAIASIMACAFFAAICGGSTLTAIAIGLIAIPEMLNRGYDRSVATGSVAAAGTLGILIPPSAIMILYSIATEVSMGKLFMAGVVPGLIIATAFSFFTYARVRRNPRLAPLVQEGISWKERLRDLWRIWPVMFLVAVVLGSIYGGMASATESGSIGAIGALILAVVYRKATWKNLAEAALQTTRSMCFVFLVIIGAMFFGFVLAHFDIASKLATWTISLEISRWGILAIIMVVLIFLGCFLEPVSIIFITMPIFFPMITALNFDPIWFGILLVINMEVANMTPPVGLNVFVIYEISRKFGVRIEDVFKGVAPFVLIDCVVIVLLCFFPDIALWLPSQMKY